MPADPPSADPLIDPATAAFMQAGVSVIAASCSADGAPSIMRAVGCRVAEDRRSVTVLLNAPQSQQLIADIGATRRVAVVFSQPTTHRSLQFKADDAEMVPTTPLDWALASQYQQALSRELETIGFPREFTMTFIAWRPGELAAVRFSPAEAWDQTPGPRAGTPLGSAA